MRRRTFVLLAAGLAAWEPLLAASNNPRIGLIGVGAQQANQRLVDALRDGLRTLGWNDGAMTLIERWAEEHGERLPSIASELISSGVDILITVGSTATLAATRATTSLPIVVVGVGNPLALGVVTSLAHPGGNVTGLTLSSTTLVHRRFSLLRELLPDLRRLAVIVRHEPGLEQTLEDIRSRAGRMGIELVAFETTTGQSLQFAFMHLRNDHCDALYVASGPLGPAKRTEIIDFAAQSHLPGIYSYRIFADNGGLMSYAVDDKDLFRRAATFVDKILKGAKPADLPVEEPTKFELVVNLKTAKALGLTVPQSILAQANEVTG
jgi:putative ABC transport system substrate-binding protein